MAGFGHFLSCEEHTPGELVAQIRMAERAVFESLWISLPMETAMTCPPVRTHPAAIAQAAATADDPQTHVEALSAFVDAGFDTEYVNQIGEEQQGFFDFYRTKVLPRLRD